MIIINNWLTVIVIVDNVCSYVLTVMKILLVKTVKERLMHQYNQCFKTLLISLNIQKNVENFEIYVDHLKATLNGNYLFRLRMIIIIRRLYFW